MTLNPVDEAAVLAEPEEYDTTSIDDAKEKVTGRRRLLPWILGGYLAVLTLSIVVPIILVPQLESDAQVKQIQDLVSSISGVSQGLFGILGVMVGYYFRQVSETT